MDLGLWLLHTKLVKSIVRKGLLSGSHSALHNYFEGCWGVSRHLHHYSPSCCLHALSDMCSNSNASMINTHICMYECMHAHAHTHVLTHAHTHTHFPPHTHAHTQTHTHRHTDTDTHTTHTRKGRQRFNVDKTTNLTTKATDFIWTLTKIQREIEVAFGTKDLSEAQVC